MSETGIKGIVLDNIPLNVMTISFMRKLEKFGCAVVMDEQGSNKYAKAQLAVLDAVIGAKAPSVLVITAGKLMYEWYSELVKGIGADFKFITPDPDSVNYFSPKLESLYITSTVAGDNPVFRQIKDSGLIWDLVIIDGGLSREGIDTDLILNSFDFKTKKLVIFAAYPGTKKNAAEKLAELPAKFLDDRGRAEYFKSNYPGEDITEFSLSTPYSRYYGSSALTAPKIKTITYAPAEDVIRARSEQDGTRTYVYGGNIFEELTLDSRKLYNAEKYDDKIVTELRKADVKLDAYINELTSLAEDSENRIITYFSSEKTLEYVYKVLCTTNVGLGRVTAVKKSGIYRIDDTALCFKAGEKSDIRILLSLDNQDEQCDRFELITHVINYELPNNPLTLHRRYKQGGRRGFDEPEFILFKDETDKFDGRMIKKALALNFCSGFTVGIPGRNIYLHIEGLEHILAELLDELSGVDDMSVPEINALAAEYNLKTTGQNAKAELINSRGNIRRAFGLPNEKTGIDAAASIIGEKLAAFRQGCCLFDIEGRLRVKSYGIENNKDYCDLEEELKKGDKLIRSRDKARKLLDGSKTSGKIYEIIRGADERDRQYIYYCTWRYLSENRRVNGDYNKFLADIFEEVI